METRPPASAMLHAPRTALTPQQQLEALRRVHAASQQRVQLGQQLFLAAEKQTTRYQQLLEQFQIERQALRQQMQQEMQATLLAASGRFQGVEDRVTEAIDRLEKRVDDLQSQWAAAEHRLAAMLERAHAALDGADGMVSEGSADVDDAPSIGAPPFDDAASAAPAAGGPALSYRELMARMYDQPPRKPREDVETAP